MVFSAIHPMGEHSTSPKTARFMNILHYNTAKSRHSFTSRAGLMVPATLLERLGLGETVDERMPGPGSNRGYRHGTIFETFMLMFHEGAECLEDVRHLHGECALAGLMGFRSLPCAATLGNGLRRVGRDRASRDVLQEVNRRVLEAALQDRDRVTLDIDAPVVHAKKKTARRTYQGRRGDTPMVGHIAGTGQVVKSGLRRGSVPPAAKNRAFLERCIEALPQGVRVSRFRADAASYQASVVNACREHGARFAIRARADRTVRAAIAAIGEDAWQPMPLEDGSPSETESVARTVHVMGGTPEAFCLVVQGRAIRPYRKIRNGPCRSRSPCRTGNRSRSTKRAPWTAGTSTGPWPPTSTGRAGAMRRSCAGTTGGPMPRRTGQGRSAATSAGPVCPAAGSAPVRWPWP